MAKGDAIYVHGIWEGAVASIKAGYQSCAVASSPLKALQRFCPSLRLGGAALDPPFFSVSAECR